MRSGNPPHRVGDSITNLIESYTHDYFAKGALKRMAHAN